MWRHGLLILLWLTVVAGPAWAASIRNVYFSNGELVPGQRYRTEGQLPGPVTTFTMGQDKAARLFIIFGDLDAHTLRGQLKASDGSVVRTLNRQVDSVKVAVTWRVVTHAFNLEPLAPGDYTLDLVVDDKATGSHTLTLR
jgi:hypothetical protein